MSDSKQILEWRKGFPLQWMLVAHTSGLWLVKDSSFLKIVNLFTEITDIKYRWDVYVWYYVDEDGEITLRNEFDSNDFPVYHLRFSEHIPMDGGRRITISHFPRGTRFHSSPSIFEGEWDGHSVKKISSKYGGESFISHVKTVLRLLQKKLNRDFKKNQETFANSYFCPIDKDGNKVPWPNSVAPRGFISWVDWDASKH